MRQKRAENMMQAAANENKGEHRITGYPFRFHTHSITHPGEYGLLLGTATSVQCVCKTRESERRLTKKDKRENARYKAPAKPLFYFWSHTFIRRSRSASSPDSVQMALMSAPESSSLAMMNTSRSTSSASVMRP